MGKSTLFNRLTETREAITDDTSGTTRDRKYGTVVWTNHQFNVIDTGGWITKSDDSFEAAIRGQVEISLEEADLILFMVEIEVGITDLDQDIANLLRRTGKPIMLVCNKVDTSAHDVGAEEFYRLGLADEIYRISAPTTGMERESCLMQLWRRCRRCRSRKSWVCPNWPWWGSPMWARAPSSTPSGRGAKHCDGHCRHDRRQCAYAVSDVWV